jgi:hypothetical protein
MRYVHQPQERAINIVDRQGRRGKKNNLAPFFRAHALHNRWLKPGLPDGLFSNQK